MVEFPRHTILCTGRAAVAPNVRLAVRRTIREALKCHKVTLAKLNIVFVDDREIARLHARFLGKPTPTDVLTFVTSEPTRRGAVPVLEGDVFVSMSTARRQAALRRHAVAAEAALYALHGVLHLLGYNDHRVGDARRMHAVEDEILCRVGIGAVFAVRPRRARPHGARP